MGRDPSVDYSAPHHGASKLVDGKVCGRPCSPNGGRDCRDRKGLHPYQGDVHPRGNGAKDERDGGEDDRHRPERKSWPVTSEAPAWRGEEGRALEKEEPWMDSIQNGYLHERRKNKNDPVQEPLEDNSVLDARTKAETTKSEGGLVVHWSRSAIDAEKHIE